MMIKHTTDTLSAIYQDALKIRNQVFIKEQGVPESREIDQDEVSAIHFVLYNKENEPVATLRLLPINSITVKLQRMAVLSGHRRLGIGRKLIEATENWVKQAGFNQIKLGAQLTAQNFYEALGFQAESEVFLDADMPHIMMSKKL